jgi:hypothetical protein
MEGKRNEDSKQRSNQRDNAKEETRFLEQII